jgi:hypothetical protein
MSGRTISSSSINQVSALMAIFIVLAQAGLGEFSVSLAIHDLNATHQTIFMQSH